MKKIELSNGFKCEIDERILKDIRFLDIVAKYEEAKEDENDMAAMVAFSKMTKMMLGKKQREAFYKSFEVDGIADVDDGAPLVTEIFEAFGEEGKN